VLCALLLGPGERRGLRVMVAEIRFTRGFEETFSFVGVGTTYLKKNCERTEKCGHLPKQTRLTSHEFAPRTGFQLARETEVDLPVG